MILPKTITEDKQTEFLQKAKLSEGGPFEFEGIRYVMTEGRIDRLRAKTAAAVGRASGSVKALRGALNIAHGSLTRNDKRIQKGQEQITKARQHATNKKLDSFQKTALKRLDYVVNDIKKDMDLLKLSFASEEDQKPSEMLDESYKTFRGYLIDLITSLKDEA